MIVIVCGPPASGKTTLATRLERRLDDRRDALESLHSDDYGRRTYDRMYATVADAVADDADTTEDDTGPADGWILDGTFFRREWRNRFYRLGDTYEVWVKASLETCLERNRERGEPVPEQGVRTIYGAFEPPRADLELETEELDVEASLDRLEAGVLGWQGE